MLAVLQSRTQFQSCLTSPLGSQECPVHRVLIRTSKHVSVLLTLKPLVDLVELADLVQHGYGLRQSKLSRMWVNHVLGQVRRNSAKAGDLLLVVLVGPVERVALGVRED